MSINPKLNYKYMSFYAALLDNASNYGNKIAIYEGELKISFNELKSHVDKLAVALVKMNVKPTDKVAVVSSNSWKFIALLFAVNKIGAVFVPINNFLQEEEITYILNDSQSKLLFASEKFKNSCQNQLLKSSIEGLIWFDKNEKGDSGYYLFDDLLQTNIETINISQVLLDSTALIVYTSGTTGKPKGAMLSNKNIFSNVQSCVATLNTKFTKVPMICYLPMFHAFTLTVTVLLPLFNASSVTVIKSIATKSDFKNVLKQLLIRRCPYFAGIPDVYNAMSRAKLPWYFHWFHNVKGFISGAAPLSEETLKRFKTEFKRGELIQGYGISECSPVVSVNRVSTNRFGSVGQPLVGYSVKIIDPETLQEMPVNQAGEICIKGDLVMKGYYNRPEDTKQAMLDGEYFRTGDIGKVDEENFIYILDRIKDLIINKGINIYPREIEELIYTDDNINACAVVGEKDSEGNEHPVAFLEAKEGAKINEDAIKALFKAKLAPFKQPRKVIVVDKLPRNATGKILKRELRDNLAQYLKK